MIRPELPSCTLGHKPPLKSASRAPESINLIRELSISFDHTRFYPSQCSVSKQMTLKPLTTPTEKSISRSLGHHHASFLIRRPATRSTFPFVRCLVVTRRAERGRHELPHKLFSRLLGSRAFEAWGNEAHTKKLTQNLLLLFVFVTHLKHSVVAGLGGGVLLNSAYWSSAGAVPG